MKWPRIAPEAANDIQQALSHFAQISPTLEAAFAGTLRAALEKIAATPGQHARLETNVTNREIRRVILWRFNYLVVFEVVNDVPTVLSVIHASRRPDY